MQYKCDKLQTSYSNKNEFVEEVRKVSCLRLSKSLFLPTITGTLVRRRRRRRKNLMSTEYMGGKFQYHTSSWHRNI